MLLVLSAEFNCQKSYFGLRRTKYLIARSHQLLVLRMQWVRFVQAISFWPQDNKRIKFPDSPAFYPQNSKRELKSEVISLRLSSDSVSHLSTWLSGQDPINSLLANVTKVQGLSYFLTYMLNPLKYPKVLYENYRFLNKYKTTTWSELDASLNWHVSPSHLFIDLFFTIVTDASLSNLMTTESFSDSEQVALIQKCFFIHFQTQSGTHNFEFILYFGVSCQFSKFFHLLPRLSHICALWSRTFCLVPWLKLDPLTSGF